MEELILQIEPRKEVGKSDVGKMRREGFVPAVVYGEGKKTEPVKISSHELFKFIHAHRLENVIINLMPKGASGKEKGKQVIIKEIQYHPVDGDIVHIDFHQLSLTKAIQVKVSVEAKGDAVGVKAEGGVLEHNLWDIEIECLPTQIPPKFEVDVSNMKIGDVVHIKDMAFSPDIKVLHDPETIVLSIVHPVKVEEAAAPEEAAAEAQEPEVIKKEKKEGEEEEAAPEEKKEEKKPQKEEKKGA